MSRNLIDRDAKFIAEIEKIRFFPVAPIGGDGCYIIEENGRRLLDFSGSWGRRSSRKEPPRALADRHSSAEQATSC